MTQPDEPYPHPLRSPYPAQPPGSPLAGWALGVALAGLVVPFASIAGAIMGHVAYRRTRSGMALAAIWIGWVLTALGVLFTILGAILLVQVLSDPSWLFFLGGGGDSDTFCRQYPGAFICR